MVTLRDGMAAPRRLFVTGLEASFKKAKVGTHAGSPDTHLNQAERDDKGVAAGSIPLRYASERVCGSAYETPVDRGGPSTLNPHHPGHRSGVVGLTVVVALIVTRRISEFPPFTFGRSWHAAPVVSDDDHDRWIGCNRATSTYTNAPTGGSQLH